MAISLQWTEESDRRPRNETTSQRRPGTHRLEEYKVGDRVLLSTSYLKLVGETHRARKLTERFIGPYRINQVINRNAYRLELPATLKIHPVINISFLKRYRDGVELFPSRPIHLTRPPPIATEDSGAPIFEVEKILDHRRIGKSKRVQYLVSWKGYPVHEATWEPIENLDGALDSVVDYNRRKKVDLGTITVIRRTYKEAVSRSNAHRN